MKRRSFIWKDGHFTIFNVPGDDPAPGGTIAFGINDKGEIVGNYLEGGLYQRILSKQKRRVHEIRGPGRAS